MSTFTSRLRQINNRIREAEVMANRSPNSVKFLAVSKTKPSSDIVKAYQAGQRHFGESYLQEALKKQKELGCFDITWHFIGPIQSNKTKSIAAHFSWVHSVDRIKIAQRLNEQRPSHLPPLKICLQINISEEESKSGYQLDELAQMVELIAKLPNLQLKGVMAIPAPQEFFEQQREPYRKIYQAVKNLGYPDLNTFSFGMSDDLEAAIAEGSTLVRIGTALFGVRDYSGNSL